MTFDPAILRLVAITNEPTDFAATVAAASSAVRGGATCVQLRAKRLGSGELVRLARALVESLPVPVIVNDRADVALAAGAAGVHLGPDDLPIPAVRALAPRDFVIGASLGANSELESARGADYVGVGPVFGSASKPDAGAAIGIEEMARLIDRSAVPGVGIGGITADNAASVLRAGASGVASLSAIFATDSPEAAARALRSAIGI